MTRNHALNGRNSAARLFKVKWFPGVLSELKRLEKIALSVNLSEYQRYKLEALREIIRKAEE
jgi:hypothetical protein